MPLTGYPDVNWFMRAARVLPAVAVAALVGGLIGGFSIYAIDSALTWQSRPDFRADNHAPEPQAMRPIRSVGGAIPDPSAGMSGPPPVQQQRVSSPAPQQQPTAHPERAANNESAVDRKANSNERAASANDDDRNGSSRRSRYSRRHANPTPNASGSAATDDRDVYSEGTRRRDARSYDRLYN